MKSILFLSALFLIGCAVTYQQPSLKPSSVIIKHNSTRSAIFSQTKLVLVSNGLTISYIDEANGIIQTESNNVDLDESDCDCGSTMGLDYIQDNRTNTTVSYHIIIDDKTIAVKANIEGDYLKGDPTQGIQLVCVSTGKLENEMINKIIN